MLPPKIPLFKCFLPGKQSSLHWAVNFRTRLLSNIRLKTRRLVLTLRPPQSSEDTTGFILKKQSAIEIQRQDRADLHPSYSCLQWSSAPDNLNLCTVEMLSPSLPCSPCTWGCSRKLLMLLHTHGGTAVTLSQKPHALNRASHNTPAGLHSSPSREAAPPRASSTSWGTRPGWETKEKHNIEALEPPLCVPEHLLARKHR